MGMGWCERDIDRHRRRAVGRLIFLFPRIGSKARIDQDLGGILLFVSLHLELANGLDIQSQRRLQADAQAFRGPEGPDFYPTPEWATHALIGNETFEEEIWEPACGDGTMVRVLRDTGRPVDASDLFDRGYGEVGVDFLKSDRKVRILVTNPPYNSAEGFVEAGLRQSGRKLVSPFASGLPEGATATDNFR